MENVWNNELAESYAMNGGEGPHSYAQNSNYQRGVVEAAKELINDAVAKNFDINTLSSSSSSSNPVLHVADLGCSSGPNTFVAVQNILEAIQLKFHSTKIPEFQVFFNDHISNDFNALFKSLPPNKQYYAAGVPGSFHSLLFPKASLHFIHSSYALHWLSKAPKEVVNKGRIHYTNAAEEVGEAYSAQYGEDMEDFLNFRAQEIVGGGLMVLLIPAVPDVVLDFETTTGTELDLLGSCLLDMAKMGLVSEAEVDSFNLPIYYTCPKELKALIERNGHFSIERMEELNNQKKHLALPNLQIRVLYFRAALEGLIEKHLGGEIMDELFNRYSMKVAKSPFFLKPQNQKSIVLFLLLKRKTNL